MQEKQKYTTLGLLNCFLRGSKRFFVCTVLAALGMTVAEMLPPQIIKFTVDSVLGEEAPSLWRPLAVALQMLGGVEALRQRLWIMAVLIVVAALAAAVFRYAFRVYNGKAGESLVESMRNGIFAHIQHLPFAWHMENQTGDIIQRCTSDVELVRNFLAEQMTSLLRIIVLLASSLYFMFGLSVPLTVLAMALLAVIVVHSLFFHKQIGSGFAEADAREGDLSAIVQENLTGVRVVRAFGREQYERQRFEACDADYSKLWMKLCMKLSTYWTSTSFLSGVQILISVVLGARYCVLGEMSAGAYLAFLSYNAMLTWPVRQLGRMISEMSKAGVSIDRIKHIMNSAPETEPADALTPPLDGDIAFENVTFGYGETPLLQNVSFRIGAGQTLGILGGTGSGKSTLVYLLDRLYDLPPQGGRITVGGVNIQQIRRDHLRKNIGLVLQEPYLFSRTIAENIGIAGDGMSEQEIRAAAQIACLDETVTGFASGYDTFVGERGVTLSGGQKQRAAIARMLATPTPIIVLDDSLSAVDTQTDARIRRALRQQMEGRTTILISHRINTLMQADHIIVLDRGRIVEQGDHTQLSQNGGIYQRIYEMQSRGEGDENNE